MVRIDTYFIGSRVVPCGRRDGRTDRYYELIVGLSILRMHLTKLHSSHRVYLGVIYVSVKIQQLLSVYTLWLVLITECRLMNFYRRFERSQCQEHSSTAAWPWRWVQYDPRNVCTHLPVNDNPYMVVPVEGKEDTPKLWAGDGTVTSAEKSRDPTRTLSQQWLTVSYGNGEAMWQEWTSRERHTLRECGTKEKTKGELGDRDPMGRHVQESSRRTLVTSSQNIERIE